jgi:phosphohistidine phosphatase SixA
LKTKYSDPLKALWLVIALSATATAQQPKGSLGIDAARHGGAVIVCRHGMTDPANEDEQTLRYDDPSTQRRLSPRGERQTRLLGDAFRALHIDVTDVIASPMQRATRSAELMFAKPRLDSAWHTRGENFSGPKNDQRVKMLATPVQRGNRAIVSHLGTITSALPRVQLEEGDCVVVRPRGETRYDIVDVVPWRAWVQAAHLDANLPQS